MSAAPGKNPFRPGVGTRPLHLAGRDGPVRRFRAMLRAAPEQPGNMRLTGLRGVGKTVLLGEFHRIAQEDGWASAMLELQPGHNTEESLLEGVTSVADTAREALSRTELLRAAVGSAVKRAGTLGVAWGDITITYDPGFESDRVDLTKSLFEATEMAVDKGFFTASR